MPNFLPNQNQPINESPTDDDDSTKPNNDIDNNIMPQQNTTSHQLQPVLLTTISVEQPDDYSNASTTTEDNLSVRSEAISDDINRNPDDFIDIDKPPKLSRQRSSLPKDASVDILASKL